MTAIRLVLAATALLLSGTVASLAAPGTITTSALVYARPNTSSQLVNKLPVGYAVDLGACDSGWCLVTALGVTGFTPQSNVRPGGPAPQPQPSQPSRPGNGGGNGGGHNGGGNGGGFGGGNNNGGGFGGGNNGGGFGNGGGFNFDFGFGNQPQYPEPQRPPRPQRPQPPVYEDAQACFYSNTNFRGDSFCVDQGDNFDDLPRSWDDRIRSVEVFGGARVDLCTDEGLSGACASVRTSQSRLPRQLDRDASSLEVY